MKYVRETAAGRKLSAFVIMKGARHVATVQVYHGQTCRVDVFEHGPAALKSLKAYIRDNGKAPAVRDFDGASIPADTPENMQKLADYWQQSGSAGGGGYDKETAAMTGLYVDGNRLADHCGERKKPPRGLPGFPADYKTPRGWSLANHAHWIRNDKDSPWLSLDFEQERVIRLINAPSHYCEDLCEGEQAALDQIRNARARGDLITGFSSCFKEHGLRYLEARGYSVIRAI